jgi:hypothetical protein
MILILTILSILSLLFFCILIFAIYIHNNKKDTKIWNFINKHIVADEDDYLKNK